MAWTAEVSSINQRIQIGAEATTALGTSVAAGKLLENYDFEISIEEDVKQYRPSGRKYDSVTEENMEWTSAKVGGLLDYNSVIYPLAGVFGSVTSVAHLASATAKDWIFTPPVTGSVVPQTYTIEQGDAVRARKLSYALFTDFGYKISRKEVSMDAALIGQLLTDGITMTNSPVAVSLSPVVGKHVNIYLDSTSGGLGTTQLNRVLSFEYSIGNMYGPFWPLNRTNVSYTGHVDLAPKPQVKIMVEADTAGMALVPYMQNGTTYFLRMDAQGAQIASDGPGSIVAEIKHDMAVKVIKTAAFKDSDGIFALEYTLDIVEDATWAKSQTVTVTNLITAL